jgi:SAM-dependent methyltransferase
MTEGDRLEPVRRYYRQRGESELHRLDNPFEGAVERELHARAFAELIPPGSRVLDLGGGPGHWTAWLLARGHRVVLGDLSPAMLEIARRELAGAVPGPEAIVELDARDLSAFPDGEFDTVLALGPFYHLVDEGDRQAALHEVRRVLRPGGLLLATVMGRYAWMLTSLLSGAPHAGGLPELLREGVYRSPVDGPLTEAYLFEAASVVPFFAAGGFEPVRLMASQGFLNQVQEEVEELRRRDEEAYTQLLELAYGHASDPSILGLGGHLLFAGWAGSASSPPN